MATNPWTIRLMILVGFIVVAQFSQTLAWLILTGCVLYLLFILAKNAGLFGQAAPAPSSSHTVPPAPPQHRDLRSICSSRETIQTFFEERIIGQPLACRVVADLLYKQAHLERGNRPFGIVCLAGPPGVGKTLMARVAHEFLFQSDPNAFLDINMAHYSHHHEANALFGTANSSQRGLLAKTLTAHPQGIVLLDEFEKAEPSVHKLFLEMWDTHKGYFTDRSDRSKISVRDTLFIVTTNAGGSALAQYPADSLPENELRSLCLAELEKAGFVPELLNRMDAIIPLTPLANEDVARVAANFIIAHLAENGLALSDGEIAISFLLKLIDEYESLGQRVSARDLIRSIRQALDDGIIAAKNQGARTVRIADRHGNIVVEPALAPTLT